MDNMFKKSWVVHNGQRVGWVQIEKRGIRYYTEAEINGIEFTGPFRLAAVCGQEILPVGVMIPQNGMYRYCKTLSAESAKKAGLIDAESFTVIGCEVERKCDERESGNDGWSVNEKPWMLFEEGEFKRVFSACRNAMVKHDDEITYVAIPVVKGENFPVMPVFCLGYIGKIGEGLYMIFKTRDGKLLF